MATSAPPSATSDAPDRERPLPRFFRIRRHFRNAIWVVPLAWILMAIFFATWLPDVDRGIRDLEQAPITADSARTVLAAIASGMITFTGFVFSMVLLVVQFGSQGFSPRYVQYVRNDRVVRNALGAFMATAIYALFSIGEVGSADVKNGRTDFVPLVTVSFAFVLTIASFGLFLALMLRVIRNFQISGAVRVVGHRGAQAINEVYPLRLEGWMPPEDSRPADPEESVLIYRHRGPPAFVVALDRRRLVAIARRIGGRMELAVPIGGHVAEGAPLIRIRGARRPPNELWLRRAIVLGSERTIEQDPGFAFRILVDVAVKALSPAINDPTSAVQVINVLDDLLRRLSTRRIRLGELMDASGVVRVVLPTPTWEDYVDLACTEIRDYGEGSVQVCRRMRAMLEDLLDAVPEARRAALLAQIDRLDAAVERGFPDDAARGFARERDPMGIGGEG